MIFTSVNCDRDCKWNKIQNWNAIELEKPVQNFTETETDSNFETEIKLFRMNMLQRWSSDSLSKDMQTC